MLKVLVSKTGSRLKSVLSALPRLQQWQEAQLPVPNVLDGENLPSYNHAGLRPKFFAQSQCLKLFLAPDVGSPHTFLVMQRSYSLAVAHETADQLRPHASFTTRVVKSEQEDDDVSKSLSPDEYRQCHSIMIQDSSGEIPPDPVLRFENLDFPAPLLEVVKKAGYKTPTPIQAQCWPLATAGRDMIAIASTGSGKTAGYLIPALSHVREVRKRALAEGRAVTGKEGAPVLVLAPTRELAKQIDYEAMKFGGSLGLRTAVLYGGSPRVGQIRQLLDYPHIIVATPGRLLDLAECGELDLTKVSYMVLDEADRMLDMGFEKDLLRISRYVPRARQTLFFSATWPQEVQRVALKFAVNDPVKVFIGKVSDRPVAALTITQLVKVVDQHEKLDELIEYIKSKPRGSRILVFVGQKHRCDWLAENLSGHPSYRDFRCCAIHGDKRQTEREFGIASFKSGRIPILIATDVASRGLDIPDVTAVVNFDMPTDAESYVHRIGRTGRAGNRGEAFSLMTKADSGIAKSIVNIIRESGQVPPEDLLQLSNSGSSSSGQQNRGRGGYGGRSEGSVRQTSSGFSGRRDGGGGRDYNYRQDGGGSRYSYLDRRGGR